MIGPAKLSPEIKRFILENEHADVPSLLLKYKSVGELSIGSVADQIIGRRKAKLKLPAYYANDDILYPPALNLEQTSSEQTARIKTEILLTHLKAAPDHIVDLTAGFGIDTFAFSKHFGNVVHVEPNEALQQLARYNHALLKGKNISYVNTTAGEYLKTINDVTAVYIDPSRRSGSKKVHSLHDCQPDIVGLQDLILAHTSILMVKASPMLDIQLALRELKGVKQVFVIALDNEVRELLFLATPGFSQETRIVAVNHSDAESTSMEFSYSEEQQATTSYSDVLAYVYEPNAAMMKAGAFRLSSTRFKVNKLHINTHLYTSDTLQLKFPGRIFRVVAPLKSDRRMIKEHFPEGKANVITRNYPSTPEVLKKKLKLSDGGDRFVLAFTSSAGPQLVAAERLK